MRGYRVLVTIEMLRGPKPSRASRDRIIRFLESLEEEPFQPGDYQELDESGRTLQIKIVGDMALTFWADHAVKEVKVVRMERADRE
ncbi:MAG TPA: hypothetical protein DCY13_22890 [Verrucomicrobiales bacterium]|nr:hypothetical protein [Verrucomicrobiales bacterium]